MEITGRERQRRRTRKAILTAASALLGRGVTPSVAEIAEAAEVSRRTVYLHFPRLEHLLADAALEVTRASVEPQLEGKAGGPARLEALVRATHRGFAETEKLGRTIIKHTVDVREAGPLPAGAPRRGYRRVEWIEQALEPLRGSLPRARYERLVSALTLLIGWEAMIVLQDVRGLSAKQAEEVCVWAANTLLATAETQARERKARA